MNPLPDYVPSVDELNALQSAGVVSDLCVAWSDVAECDRARAFVWLLWNKGRKEAA